MSNQNHSTIDPYKHLKIIHNADGTLTRLPGDYTSPVSDPTLPISVLSKDISINQSHNTWLRIFLPRKATLNNQQNHKLLPLIVYFHGSGFILASAASTMFHDFCVNMADTVGALVASVGYRLAPENRLPAAYDDAVEALLWIRSCQDEWFTNYADYSNCYLMGSSAGATIAYYAGLRAIAELNSDDDDVEPLKIRGLILRQAAFGGTKRTESELRLANDQSLPLPVVDLMWELALPLGVDRDHEYSNPTAGDGPKKIDKIREAEWRVLVSGNEGDPLVDREKELAVLMEEKGVQVVTDFEEGGRHGIEFAEPFKAERLFELLKGFISSAAVSGIS